MLPLFCFLSLAASVFFYLLLCRKKKRRKVILLLVLLLPLLRLLPSHLPVLRFQLLLLSRHLILPLLLLQFRLLPPFHPRFLNPSPTRYSMLPQLAKRKKTSRSCFRVEIWHGLIIHRSNCRDTWSVWGVELVDCFFCRSLCVQVPFLSFFSFLSSFLFLLLRFVSPLCSLYLDGTPNLHMDCSFSTTCPFRSLPSLPVPSLPFCLSFLFFFSSRLLLSLLF